MGGSIQFEPGCTLKLTNNSYVIVYGPLNFQNTQQTPVFTSFQDDAFGEDIDGIPGSTPSYHASAALWVYYVNFGTWVKRARFRWAKTAIRYDGNPGVYASHLIQSTLIEHCQTGIWNNTAGTNSIGGHRDVRRADAAYGPFRGYVDHFTLLP